MYSKPWNSEQRPNGKPDFTNFHIVAADPRPIPVMFRLVLVLGSSQVAVVVPKVRNA